MLIEPVPKDDTYYAKLAKEYDNMDRPSSRIALDNLKENSPEEFEGLRQFYLKTMAHVFDLNYEHPPIAINFFIESLEEAKHWYINQETIEREKAVIQTIIDAIQQKKTEISFSDPADKRILTHGALAHIITKPIDIAGAIYTPVTDFLIPRLNQYHPARSYEACPLPLHQKQETVSKKENLDEKADSPQLNSQRDESEIDEEVSINITLNEVKNSSTQNNISEENFDKTPQPSTPNFSEGKKSGSMFSCCYALWNCINSPFSSSKPINRSDTNLTDSLIKQNQHK